MWTISLLIITVVWSFGGTSCKWIHLHPANGHLLIIPCSWLVSYGRWFLRWPVKHTAELNEVISWTHPLAWIASSLYHRSSWCCIYIFFFNFCYILYLLVIRAWWDWLLNWWTNQSLSFSTITLLIGLFDP